MSAAEPPPDDGHRQENPAGSVGRSAAADDACIDLLSIEETLKDGTRVFIRPIRAEDKVLLEEGVRRLSPTSRYLRFMRYFERLTPSELRYLTEVDYHDHFAWIAIGVDVDGDPGLGVARYIRDTDQPDQAEAAVAVIDDYQNRGLGTLLLSKLANTARENGIEAFVAYVTPENPLITRLLQSVSATAEEDQGLLRVVVPIGEDAPGPANRAILRAAARGDVELRSPSRSR
ncbi:MAG: GNAT family N-acetyltransferase [Acidimicrobiia bacterium]